MTTNKNKRLTDSKYIAKKEFEANKLKELTIKGISLTHADKYNFIVEGNNSRGYFGILKAALRRFFVLLNGEISIAFENFADLYEDVKPSMPCNLIDIENIKKELLKGLNNEKA
ncbi:hypothetical protein [Poseidonibacter ostreae]|uniref:Uncharacterized protein n=1 Tax=Poseidonibacter ostreae TaxID=2654171 RepID=A0ABQ6VNB2_9BACT|nr:hypothetical protein [Poseidonibacter ostreae]KAB7889732.1 hypothetical protein GBG18_10550 [Poseidonibacter ostreae]